MKADKYESKTAADKTLKETPISRRGLFAALAVAAGLGLLGADDAFGWDYWGQNAGIGQGFWDAYGMLKGHVGRSRSYTNPSAKCMGYATSWCEWTCWPGTQQLRCALNLQIECDYENTLWYHLSFYPLSACGDTNYGTSHRLWYDNGEDDNRGRIYEDAPDDSHKILDFNCDLTNNYSGCPSPGQQATFNTGWERRSYKDTSKWYRRTGSGFSHSFAAWLELRDIRIDKVWHSEWGAKAFGTGWCATSFPAIPHGSRQDFFGIVCRVHAAVDDSLNWDVCNAKSSNRTPIYQQELFAGNDKTRPEPNLNQLFLTEFANYQEIGGSYADADQSYLITFRPAHVVDGSAALNAWGGGPFDGTDIRNSTKREFVIHKYTKADRTCGWWLVDKWNSDGTKNAVQVISDASGQAVNRYGGTTAKPTQLFMWHDGYDTDTQKNKASEWVIEEVPFTGKLELNSGAEEITWPQAPTCGDPFATCYPAKKELWETMGKPTAMIYRWYAAKTPDPAPDEDAVVMGQAHISKTGDFMEVPAYRHVGTNFNPDYALEAFRLYLKGTGYEGSIGYMALSRDSGTWSDARTDGEWIGQSGASLRWSQIKVWLQGEVARHYDLEVRAFQSDVSWCRTYVSATDTESAPAVGVAGKTLRCIQVDLIPKPTDAVLVKEFSRDAQMLELTEDEAGAVDGMYLSCAVQQEFKTEKRSGTAEVWPLVHRFHGTIVTPSVKYYAKKSLITYYADGVDDEHIVYIDHAGPGKYTASDAATQAAVKAVCNLNEHFGDTASSGFTGWFTTRELIDSFGGIDLDRGQKLDLYGRNRCTLRIDYADGSLRPEDGVDYKSQPGDGAASISGALGLPDFSGDIESHALDGIDLPAIGDNGVGHMAVYYGERISLATPKDVYRKMGDGTWRHIMCDAYLTDRAGGGRPCRTSRWSGTPRSTSGGATPIQTASPRQRSSYEPGRRRGLRPQAAHVPYGRCA